MRGLTQSHNSFHRLSFPLFMTATLFTFETLMQKWSAFLDQRPAGLLFLRKGILLVKQGPNFVLSAHRTNLKQCFSVSPCFLTGWTEGRNSIVRTDRSSVPLSASVFAKADVAVDRSVGVRSCLLYSFRPCIDAGSQRDSSCVTRDSPCFVKCVATRTRVYVP